MLWNEGVVCLETIDTRDFFVRGVKVGFEQIDENSCKIRIISARKATKIEIKQYNEGV